MPFTAWFPDLPALPDLIFLDCPRWSCRTENACAEREREEVAVEREEFNMEMVIVQLPRGRTAVMQFDPVTCRVITNHAGLYASFFEKGVRGIDGRLLFPADGRPFFIALFDRLFLSGYALRCLRLARSSDVAMRGIG
jgi:hypothetical protein